MSSRPALFLDRDGVINIDHGYVSKPEAFEFVDGIFELCRVAVARGYRLVVITNQAGIGRGYYDEATFLQLTDWMKARFRERGCALDAVYFCPYHPEKGVGGYRKDDACRKPRPGMILRAERDLQIALPASVLVGDKASDIKAGQAAGVGTNLLYVARAGRIYERESDGATAVISALSEAEAYL